MACSLGIHDSERKQIEDLQRFLYSTSTAKRNFAASGINNVDLPALPCLRFSPSHLLWESERLQLCGRWKKESRRARGSSAFMSLAENTRASWCLQHQSPCFCAQSPAHEEELKTHEQSLNSAKYELYSYLSSWGWRGLFIPGDVCFWRRKHVSARGRSLLCHTPHGSAESSWVGEFLTPPCAGVNPNVQAKTPARASSREAQEQHSQPCPSTRAALQHSRSPR